MASYLQQYRVQREASRPKTAWGALLRCPAEWRYMTNVMRLLRCEGILTIHSSTAHLPE